MIENKCDEMGDNIHMFNIILIKDNVYHNVK